MKPLRVRAHLAFGIAQAAPWGIALDGLLAEQLRPGDVVLVKASRAGGLERIAEAVLVGGDR